jgi:hypothetical protein
MSLAKTKKASARREAKVRFLLNAKSAKGGD